MLIATKADTRQILTRHACAAMLTIVVVAALAIAGPGWAAPHDVATGEALHEVQRGTDCGCPTSDHGPSYVGNAFIDFFTGDGWYMPRTHCLGTPTGESDWPWIITLLVLTAGVILAYLRIFIFWMRSYFGEERTDRNPRLFDLAAIFLFCAVCGYAMSIVMFVWPAYRLLAAFLLVLNVFSWRFCCNLRQFRSVFASERLGRQLREATASRTVELERLVAERTVEVERLRQLSESANDAKSEFLANMSHEIRTPMTSILGYADILAEDELDLDAESRKAHLDTIRRNGEHLLTLINDILDLSKIEAGKMTVERIPMNLDLLLKDVMALMEVKAKAKNIRLELKVTGPIPTSICSDPVRLKQILVNLVGNAIKFTETGGVLIRVEIRDRPPFHRNQLHIAVEDTGIGLSLDQLSRLFQAFTQAESGTTRRFGGTGLGLRISKTLAEMLGGDISVVSEPGRGSVFSLTIDAGSPRGSPAMSIPAASAAKSLDGRPLAGRRIFVAEDGLDNQKLIAYYLERAGATVSLFLNGRDALKALTIDGRTESALASPPPCDILITDMQMPELDGYGLAQSLRAKGSTLPILALTAHAMSGDSQRCVAAGCNRYSTKPIDRVQLVNACLELLKLASDDRAAA